MIDVLHPRASSYDVDEAIVVDEQGQRWTVRAPQRPAVGAVLEVEVSVLGNLRNLPVQLPFAVPSLVGTAPLPEGGRVFVNQFIPGQPLDVETLQPGPGLAADLGRCIAAVHELPPVIVEAAGLPSYSAEEYRKRRLVELDEAARSAKVPVHLLERWEQQLENVALWRFTPVVTHADLAADVVLTQDAKVSGLLSWGTVQVADPADDLAWLMASVPAHVADTVLEAYWLARTELRDPHLPARAALASELALVRWLLHGINTESADVVADAEAMLLELSQQLLAEEAAAEAAEEARRHAELAAAEVDEVAEVAEVAEVVEGTEVTVDADHSEFTPLPVTHNDETETEVLEVIPDIPEEAEVSEYERPEPSEAEESAP